MPRKILAPHKEQDGWVYVRVSRSLLSSADSPDAPRTLDVRIINRFWANIWYPDRHPGSRVISSRRVEQDVETGDYLRLCADEGLTVNYFSSPGSAPCWIVTSDALESTFRGAAATLPHAPTLREAYHRYHAAADREDAS